MIVDARAGMRICKKTLLWLAFVLLTLPLFNPLDGYSAQVELIVNSLRAVSALVTAVWLLLVKRRLSPIVLLVGIWQAYLLLNTLIQGDAQDLRYCFTGAATTLSIVMLYDLMQDDEEIFLSSQMFCFELMIYINLATVLLFPNGLYVNSNNILGIASRHCYWLGMQSIYPRFCIPALLIASLWKAHTKSQKLRKALLMTAIFVTIIKTWAVTALIVVCLMGAAYLFLNKLPSLFNYFSVWSLHIWFFIGVVWLRIQNIFRWLIEGVLHKWQELLWRTTTWDIAMGKISQAWFWGYGYAAPIKWQVAQNVPWGYHAHNMLLETLYEGGIVNLALFGAIIYVAGKYVYKYRTTKQSKLITVAFLGWCVTGLAGLPRQLIYTLLIVAYYSNRDQAGAAERDPLRMPKWDIWLRTGKWRI